MSANGMDVGEELPTITKRIQVGQGVGPDGKPEMAVVYVRVVLRADKPVMLFLDSGREGETHGGYLRVLGRHVTRELREGKTLEQAVEPWLGEAFGPSGLSITHGEEGHACRSILDGVAWWLMRRFSGAVPE